MRRITIIDDDSKVGIDLSQFCMLNLGNEVYLTSDLIGDKKREIPPKPEEELLKVFGNLTYGDAVLLIGPGAFPILQKWYHFGIRGENYYDCSRLKRLGTNAGFFVKCIHELDLPTLNQKFLDAFLSPEFSKVRDFPVLNYRVLHTYKDAIPFLRYFHDLPKGTKIGFDYEGSGMAFDPTYHITGASFALQNGTAAFFSFTDIQRVSSQEEYLKFIQDFRSILKEHELDIWVFNASYEAQVTWRSFGYELNFKDAAVFNIVDGLHSKNYSLKWSMQRILGGGTEYAPYLNETDAGGVLPWDTEFDDLENLLNNMYYVMIQDPGSGKKKVFRKEFKVTPENYKSSSEWAIICNKYPGYISEFELLISEHFGNPFENIPSEILGKYCCLDSYYTVMSESERGSSYSDLCYMTYLENISLGHKLMRSGLYINDDFRLRYNDYCDKMMLYGITYAALYMTRLKMDKHAKKANKLVKYSPECKLLLERGEFYNGNAVEIVKTILAQNIDENDFSDSGLDEGSLLFKYGRNFAIDIVDMVKAAMKETKFKGKIDSSVTRKKKILGVLAEKFTTYLKLDKLNLGVKHQELEKYLYYEKGYKMLLDVNSQIPDINNIPDKITIFGNTYTTAEAAELIMNGYYRCSSPIDNAELTKELIDRFLNETIFLAVILKETNKLPREKKFYSDLGITNPQIGYEHWKAEYQTWLNSVDESWAVLWPENYTPSYPLCIWYTSQMYLKTKFSEDALFDIWESWKGFDSMDKFFGISKNWEEMKTKYTEDVFARDAFYQMRLFMINILLYKKYSKIKKTYINGLFADNSRYVIETPNLMPLRNATPEEIEAGVATKKCFVKAEVLKKETKRWSSGYHTIPSHMDAKACVTCPVIVDPQTGKRTATFMSYFDISSAEVRTLGYKSGDVNLINLFETGQDVYIHTAKAHLGETKWESLSKGDKKAQRKIFKVVFLAVAYRMSARTLGANLNVSEEEAQGLIDTLFHEFPTLKGYIEEKTKKPKESGYGLVETLLGDSLQVTDWRFKNKLNPETGKITEDRGKLAKCERAGINYCIQNYSAVSLAAGFNHVQTEAMKDGFVCRNVIVVHDSCENYVDINKIFEIFPYYMDKFMEYSYKLYGIRFLFDLDVGISYGEMATLRQISETEISLTGPGSTLLEFLRKMREESDLVFECDKADSELQPDYDQDNLHRFIDDHQCCMVKDNSEYTIKLKKITSGN